jgi:hypothetical protein
MSNKSQILTQDRCVTSEGGVKFWYPYL